MEVHVMAKALFSIALVGFLALLTRLFNELVEEPRRLRCRLSEQGINGPPRSFLNGNTPEIRKTPEAKTKGLAPGEAPITHDCATPIFPFLEKWRNLYGQVFMFSLGKIQILHVSEPNMVREITTCTSLDLGKPSYQQEERGSLLGRGVLTSNGIVWARQRKIIAPELYLEKIKRMTNLITESAIKMVDSWTRRVELEGGVADIKIDQDIRTFSGDVISKACFGSNYLKGEWIFKTLRALMEVSSKTALPFGIPFMRLIPTKNNREKWALEKELRRLMLKVVRERKEDGYEQDLLQMILEASENSDLSKDDIDRFIVDNCKNIYLAGYETTAISAAWCLMLLAANPAWQDRVRAEVLQISKGQVPDYDMLRKMKELNMVIHESLRLYPPAPIISREVYKDMKFGEILIPKGFNIWIPILTLHTDPENWGPDAYRFNRIGSPMASPGLASGHTCTCPSGLDPGYALDRTWPLLSSSF
ncbi:hypothetical protein NMG60_11034365 [Bertholletia excelsa]